MRHPGAGAVCQHIARPRVRRRLEQTRNALRVITLMVTGMWIGGTIMFILKHPFERRGRAIRKQREAPVLSGDSISFDKFEVAEGKLFALRVQIPLKVGDVSILQIRRKVNSPMLRLRVGVEMEIARRNKNPDDLDPTRVSPNTIEKSQFGSKKAKN
jgi:hypothetical protein